MKPGHELNKAAVGGTLPQQWLDLVGAFGERPAFRKKSRGVWHTLTWREWHAQVCALVRNWQGRGIGRGASVLVMIGNRFEWPIVDMAAQILGAPVVGVHPSASTREIDAVFAASSARFAVLETTTAFERLLAAGLLSGVTSFVVDPGRDSRALQGCSMLELASPSGAGADAEREVARLVDVSCGTQVAARVWDPISGNEHTLSQGDLCREAGRGSDEDGRWTVAIVSFASVAERIRQWRSLVCGGTVHFPEDPDTIPNDLREVTPDVVFAPPEFWESQRSEITSTIAEAPRLARALFEFASGTTNPGWLKRALSRNVRTHIGIENARVVFDTPSPANADLVNWYRSIGAAVVLGSSLQVAGSSVQVAAGLSAT